MDPSVLIIPLTVKRKLHNTVLVFCTQIDYIKEEDEMGWHVLHTAQDLQTKSLTEDLEGKRPPYKPTRKQKE